jgi:hypothetical protein
LTFHLQYHISSCNFFGKIKAPPITPRPPAFETATANVALLMVAISAKNIGLVI